MKQNAKQKQAGKPLPAPKRLREQTFEDIFTFAKLLEAHKRARLGKGGKRDMIQFELNLAANLWQLHRELHGGSYRVSGYHCFKVYEPKEREIQALTYKDRIVQHALCDNLLTPYLETRLIYDNAACRQEKGTHFALRRVKKFLAEHARQNMAKGANANSGYFLKADIRKFFASIDHEVLKDKLIREHFSSDICSLLCGIIDSHNADSGKGLPIGNQTSQAFAIYYLDEMDRYIKEKAQIKYYSRYMDDMVLVHESKQKLKQTLEGMKQIAAKLKLEFNEKTQITPLRHGIDYLGWHFYVTDSGKTIMRLRQQAKRKMLKQSRIIGLKTENGEITEQKRQQSVASWAGHLKHGNAHGIMERIKARAGL